MMADFNADNQKIDAALSAPRFRTIAEYTVAADTRLYSVPLTDIDWTKWRAVHLEFYPAEGSATILYLCWNANIDDHFTTLPANYARLILYPFGSSFAHVCAAFFGGGSGSWKQGGLPFSQLSSITDNRTDTTGFLLKAGSRVVLSGELL